MIVKWEGGTPVNHPGKPRVIAISAPSGGGKTTIVRRLKETVENSKVLYFDDYDFSGCPEDTCVWAENGANYQEWNLTPLIQDLQAMLAQKPCYDYIFLDYPFAYLQEEMAKLIDLAVYVDTPLDIALARRLLRDFENVGSQRLKQYLNHYVTRGRLPYLEALRSVKPNSDYMIDGSLTLDVIVDFIMEKIN